MLVKFIHIFSIYFSICTAVEFGINAQRRRIFTATQEGFQLDGEKFHIYAGEIHYFRIASCWWHDRLIKLQKFGFNTVSTAIEWAMHEPRPEKYHWNKNTNFVRFIELALRLNLFVIVRAGPFIDADRDFGGLPRWLYSTNVSKFKHQNRGSISEYRYYVKRWLNFLLPKLAGMTTASGGPIIMFQIDSDLGDSPLCGNNEWLYDIFSSNLGTETVFFTMNDNYHQSIFCGHINGTLPAIRTNPLEYSTTFNGSITKLFAPVQETYPNFPKLVELRCGTAWFWGGKRFVYDSQDLELAVSHIISSGASMILYMFAGGTNFERSGCSESNTNGMITSYDYNAPVSETGDIAERYFRLKSILTKQAKFANNGNNLLELKGRNRALYSKLNFTCAGSLLDAEIRKDLGAVSVHHLDPLMFHEIADLSPEIVIYETIVPPDLDAKRGSTEIRSIGIYDRGYVYVGRTLIGIMNHSRHTIKVANPIIPGQRIQILVENQGYRMHANFGDRKGITSDIFLNNVKLRNWTMHALFFDDVKIWQAVAARSRTKHTKLYSCLLQATFITSPNFSMHTDSILDVSNLGKGQVFLNEYSVGKFWPRLGPQQYLYVPGCYIKPHPRVNRVLVLDFYHRSRPRRAIPRWSRNRRKTAQKLISAGGNLCSVKCFAIGYLFIIYTYVL